MTVFYYIVINYCPFMGAPGRVIVLDGVIFKDTSAKVDVHHQREYNLLPVALPMPSETSIVTRPLYSVTCYKFTTLVQGQISHAQLNSQDL